jgi:hypothetical protein
MYKDSISLTSEKKRKKNIFVWVLSSLTNAFFFFRLSIIIFFTTSDGRSFSVKNKYEFVRVLPEYGFHQTKYDSFQRQLSYYGFRRLHWGTYGIKKKAKMMILYLLLVPSSRSMKDS